VNICNFIGTGRENAVTREQLRIRLNLPDRKIRKLIQDARDRGEIILNDQSGAGYYMSDDIGELKRQFNTNRRRALSILRQQKYLRQKIEAAEKDDQITLEEVL
jgi:hypothetical protein